MVACTFDSCASKVETSGSLELVVSQPILISEHKVPARDSVSKRTKGLASEEQYLRLTSGLHTHMNKHTCTTHTHLELLKYKPHS